MERYIHLFENDQQQNQEYTNNYSAPWLSASKEGSIKFNNENYILLEEGGNAIRGKRFSTENFNNNKPVIFWKNLSTTINNSEEYGGHVTDIVLVDDMWGKRIEVLTDVVMKGSYEYIQIDLGINRWNTLY